MKIDLWIGGGSWESNSLYNTLIFKGLNFDTLKYSTIHSTIFVCCPYF